MTPVTAKEMAIVLALFAIVVAFIIAATR